MSYWYQTIIIYLNVNKYLQVTNTWMYQHYYVYMFLTQLESLTLWLQQWAHWIVLQALVFILSLFHCIYLVNVGWRNFTNAILKKRKKPQSTNSKWKLQFKKWLTGYGLSWDLCIWFRMKILAWISILAKSLHNINRKY